MPEVSIDGAQLSGIAPGVANLKDMVVWLYPYQPYGAPQLVTTDKLVVDTVDGVGSTFLPETPDGNALWVEIRRVRLPESARKFLVAIPAGDCNLFDLDHLDKDTLDPTVPPSPAWLSSLNTAVPLGGTTGQVLAKASDADHDDVWVDQTGGGGGGAVASVNTKTGVVVINPDDLDDTSTTHKFVTAAEKTKLSNTSGTNTGDQDLSGLVPNTRTVAGHALSSNVTLVKGDVGLGNVDNTADTAKPVSTAQAAADTAIGTAAATDATTKANAAQAAAATDATNKVATETTRATTAEALLAPKASPALTGTPTAPTAPGNTNNTQLATTAYADAAAIAATVGLLDYRGSYNASGNAFPSSGGSGSAGAILKGDFWVVSVAGTLGSKAVTAGDLVIALVDTPGSTASNWDLISHDIGYAPEDVANKSIDGTLAGNSDTLYPSQKATKTYVDGKVIDSIADADTTHAPSRNAVFDALALLAPLASPVFTGNPTAPTPTAGDNDTSIATTAFVETRALAAVVDSIADADTTHAPSRNAVFDALALTAPLASPTFTGDPKAPTAAVGDADTSIANTLFVAQNAQPLRKQAKYINTITGFFGTNGYFWSGGQRTTTTTLTSSILAGATVLPVADATGIVAGMSLLLAGGTSSQKVVQVLSVAALNVTLVSGTGVPAQASGATVGMVWADSVHLTSEGYTGIAYAVMNAKNPDGSDVFSVASGERVTFIGNSWFAGNAQWATATTNKFSGALVTNVGVGGDHGTDVIARFATDVPSTSKYVVFNEPGGNSIGSDSMPLIASQLAVMVRLIQGIGAIPIYTGTAPLGGLANTSAAMIADLFRDGYSMSGADGIVGLTDQPLTTWYPGTADNTTAATFTNKRITKRAYSNTTTTSWTIAADSFDVATLTALAAGCTINAPSGTPTAGQSLIIRIKDNATARALTWNSIFRVVGTTLPTTTVVSKTVYVGCIYNSDDSKWDVIAVAQEA